MGTVDVSGGFLYLDDPQYSSRMPSRWERRPTSWGNVSAMTELATATITWKGEGLAVLGRRRVVDDGSSSVFWAMTQQCTPRPAVLGGSRHVKSQRPLPEKERALPFLADVGGRRQHSLSPSFPGL